MHELIELEERGWRALSTAGDAGNKFYASVLREEGSEPYVALVSSTYVQDGAWQLVVHQQTPA